MQIGFNSNKERVHIRDAKHDGAYYCPSCNAPLIQRRGEIKAAHFAHASGHLCSDDWKYEMSEWHLEWQNRYPDECIEVVMENHRADVFVNEAVIEFQHSPMSPSEFEERNTFYTSFGYPLVWLFDERDSDITQVSANSYIWKYARKTLYNFNPYGNVQVYLQIGEDEIIRLISLEGQNLTTSSSEHYTCDSFYALTVSGKLPCPVPFHYLRAGRRPNGETEVFGCPINPDGFAPQMREHDRVECSECQYFIGMQGECYKCSGRYRNLDIRSIVDDSDSEITYIDSKGILHTAQIDMPNSPVMTLPEIAYGYDSAIIIVKNIKNHYRYKIRNIREQYAKYERIYGNWASKQNGQFTKERGQIYFIERREWIVEWFRTADQVNDYIRREKRR